MPEIDCIPKQQRFRNWAWVWLVYTGFLFLDPILEPSRNLWIGTLIVFALFLALFFRFVVAADNGEPTRYWVIVATFLLGLIAFPWNQGASTFFIYAACFLPFTIPSIRKVFMLFAVESLMIFAEGSFFHGVRGFFHVSWTNTFIAIFLVLVIGGGNIFFAEQRRFNLAQAKAQQDIHAVQAENLALAAVAERERIARDLHDVLGHTLSVIVLKAELANRLLTASTPDTTRAATEVADIERITRTALSEVREAIGGYRARGLAAEIEAARLTLDAAGVTLHLDSGPTPAAALTAQEETALALALREAVTNIVRHSRATTCRLRFATEGNQRRLIIEDNGIDPSSSSPPVPIREGNGIRGMRQRIESLGGHLTLHHDNGTRLLIELPLAVGSLPFHESAAS